MSELSPTIEFKKAEEVLTPEQKIQSQARHELMKNQDSLVKTGVSEEQVQKAAEIASEAALQEHKALTEQNPWKTTTDILNEAINGLEGDDKILAETYLGWSSDFPTGWKKKMEYYQYLDDQSGRKNTFSGLLAKIRWNNDGASIMKSTDEGDYPSFQILGSKLRGVIEPNLDQNGPKARELVTPSEDATRSILEALGAETPVVVTPSGKEVAEAELIATKVPGVFLSIRRGSYPNVTVNFSAETLEKMITLPHNKE